jgi:endonuclease YncB( thermonuclease family)
MFKEVGGKVEVRAWFAVGLIALVGCSGKRDYSKFQTGAADAKTVSVVASSKSETPRTLKLTLTLDSPQDLRVKSGDGVSPGQVVSDRASERDRLLQQKAQLSAKLESLKSVSVQQSSYAVENAKVEEAIQAVRDAKAEVSRFKEASPWTAEALKDVPLPQEASQLAVLEGKYQQAKNDLKIARAQLQEAREQRKSTRNDTSAQKAQLLTQIQLIDERLPQLGAVRSPYGGSVKSVKWLGQNNRELQVELILAVTDSPSSIVAAAPDPSPALPEQKTKPSAPPSSGFKEEWRVMSVHDGDTIRVRNGSRTEKVRFACVDAPELKQPLGVQSRDYLRQLIAASGDRVALKVVGKKSYGRMVAEVYTGGKLVQLEQVQSGTVYVYQKYLSNCPSAAVLEEGQEIAQQQHLGVWAGEYEKPWDYRLRIKRSPG